MEKSANRLPRNSRLNRRSRYAVVLACALALATGCGGGGGDSTPVATPPVAPPPVATGLLTDAQLRTPVDASSALVDDDTATWFAQNAKIIRSLTADDDFSDLVFLRESIENKSLVMLGESSHGVREFSQAKIRLIKYLHEEQGFNVLAFEGGLFDCENAQRRLESNQPAGALRSCLFGVWQTAALAELFDYLVATQSTSTPLRITGFDVQASGEAFALRAGATAALVGKVSPDYAEEVVGLEREFAQLTSAARAASTATDGAIGRLGAQLPVFRNAYLLLADYLLANQSVITADGEFSERDVLIAAQYARTSPDYAQQISELFFVEQGGRARDRGMAANLIALSTRIYPNERIIGWAHNAHLRHQGTGFLPDANMGALVHAELASRLYTIGFYMYRGQHAFNDRSLQQVSAPVNFSLESIFYSRRLSWLFLDIENATRDDAGAAWLTQSTPTWAWGSWQVPLILHQEYDGVVIIDTVTPPDYL
ncbi:MAG: erythromycin esterase family protein [Gammaproteobacteria bacterium]